MLLGAITNNSGGGSASVEYMYNADGIRVRKKFDNEISNYIVDENRDYAQVLEERNISGNLTASYVYGGDLISQIRGAVESYYLYDGHGSTRFLINQLGNKTDIYNYDAFGMMIGQTGNTVNEYLYAGEQYDLNAGLYYLRSRYMNPVIGRFITMDSCVCSLSQLSMKHYNPCTNLIAQPFSMLLPRFGVENINLYIYALNNPINRIDPNGKFSISETLTVMSINAFIGAFTDGLTDGLKSYMQEKDFWAGATIMSLIFSVLALIGKPVTDDWAKKTA